MKCQVNCTDVHWGLQRILLLVLVWVTKRKRRWLVLCFAMVISVLCWKRKREKRKIEMGDHDQIWWRHPRIHHHIRVTFWVVRRLLTCSRRGSCQLRPTSSPVCQRFSYTVVSSSVPLEKASPQEMCARQRINKKKENHTWSRDRGVKQVVVVVVVVLEQASLSTVSIHVPRVYRISFFFVTTFLKTLINHGKGSNGSHGPRCAQRR